MLAEVYAREVGDDVLLGDLDLLSDTRHLALDDGGEDADRRVEP